MNELRFSGNIDEICSQLEQYRKKMGWAKPVDSFPITNSMKEAFRSSMYSALEMGTRHE